MSKLFLSVEIGGTKQQIALGDENGTIFKSKQVKLTYTRGAKDILDWLSENIDSYIRKNRIHAIGVGFGGPLENKTGRVLCSLQIPGWKDFKLKNWFENEFHIPTVVINDTVAGGYAEWISYGRKSKHFFYTNIGTGIGGVLYIDGKEYDGIGYGAAYLGNSYVPDWTVSQPGALTKLELICSGKSIEKRLNRSGYIPQGSILLKETDYITCKHLAQGVLAQDSFSMAELDKIANTFSIGLCNVLALLAPDTIVIGGGVANMGDILFNRIRHRVSELIFVINRNNYQIRESQLKDHAVTVGALQIAANMFP